MLVALIIEIIVGAIVGWLAGIIMKCEGSLLRNIIIGVLGGALSGLIFNGTSKIIGFVCTVACSCLIIWVAKKVLK